MMVISSGPTTPIQKTAMKVLRQKRAIHASAVDTFDEVTMLIVMRYYGFECVT
jgi:hypothetical protein